MNFLRLSYLPEDEWHGALQASVQCDGFAGLGSAWFNRSQIDDFIARLEACPLRDGEEPALAGGFFDDGGQLVEETLGIRILRHDAIGTLRACVHLSNRLTAGSDNKQALDAVILTTYADVASFRSALVALVAGKIGEAELRGKA